MTPTVKICGLSTALTLDAALDAGADMVGFVFFSKSPRHIDWATARALGRQARGRAKIVALSVDADDDTLKRIVDALSPDLMQLHGSETPARVKRDRRALRPPDDEGDRGGDGRRSHRRRRPTRASPNTLLIDAKPPKGAVLPGGNGRPFDWSLTREFRPSVPWLLSGGLDPDTVAAGDRAERRARRRCLLRRRERARRQGSGQDQGVCRGGAARVRARRGRSWVT